MSAYALTPLAKADIFKIWSYIADDNVDAADRVEQAIYDACAVMAEGPLRGHFRPDLTSRPRRFWTLTRYPNYAVVPARDGSPSGGCRSAREKESPATPERAPVIARSD
jgi:antitoxin ParD1/3/4